MIPHDRLNKEKLNCLEKNHKDSKNIRDEISKLIAFLHDLNNLLDQKTEQYEEELIIFSNLIQKIFFDFSKNITETQPNEFEKLYYLN